MTVDLSEIAKALKAEIHVQADNPDLAVEIGTASDLMSDMLRGPTSGAVLITGLNNIQVIRTSVIAGVAAVVMIRGKQPSPEMVEQAREHGLPLLSTPLTMFSACGRLYSIGLRGVGEKGSAEKKSA